MNLKKIAEEALDEAGLSGEGAVEVVETEDEAQEVKNLRHMLRSNRISKKEFSSGLAALAALGKVSMARMGAIKRQMFIDD